MNDHYEEAVTRLRSEIPPVQVPTPEELERRKQVVDSMLRRRDRVGPIGIRADDLKHEARSEERTLLI